MSRQLRNTQRKTDQLVYTDKSPDARALMQRVLTFDSCGWHGAECGVQHVSWVRRSVCVLHVPVQKWEKPHLSHIYFSAWISCSEENLTRLLFHVYLGYLKCNHNESECLVIRLPDTACVILLLVCGSTYSSSSDLSTFMLSLSSWSYFLSLPFSCHLSCFPVCSCLFFSFFSSIFLFSQFCTFRESFFLNKARFLFCTLQPKSTLTSTRAWMWVSIYQLYFGLPFFFFTQKHYFKALVTRILISDGLLL